MKNEMKDVIVEETNQCYEAQISELRNELKATAAAEQALNNIRLCNLQQALNFAREDLTRDETTKTHSLWYMIASVTVFIASLVFTSLAIFQGDPFSKIAPIVSSVLITAVPGIFIMVKLSLDAIVSVTLTRNRIVVLKLMVKEVQLSNANITKEVLSLLWEVAETSYNESHENVWHELQTPSRRHTSYATIHHK
ncbi:hypothetical protein BDK51DRAFT_31568 [Blyttiomyces helicus]|uniref:Uncharacterized protein n=1 Tax=Blyttiomyces helicus TaxID=388810 RepID=A0A4P9WT29_9FUNG|nr:hypothetical protein BDK51DRAFT_31568 [Blyttiomyces helicus]|eukprot:RKO94206.1 hypothetical protein BDK51DRAFT_31568 [Blyttiomyces helicus]